MKHTVLLHIVLSLFLGSGLTAQNITGEYYGIGNVTKDGNYSQYLTELILIQKGNTVTGEFNYYFKSSHITSRVKGVFEANTRLLKLQLVPVLNYKAVNNLGADCPMQGYFLLRLSNVETTLSGEFEAVDAYKYTCPSIFIKLKKETLTTEEKTKMEVARAAEAITNKFDSITTAKYTPDTTSTFISEAEEPVRTSRWNNNTGKKTTSKNTISKKTATNSKVNAAKQDVATMPQANEVTKINKPVNKKIDTTKAVVIATKPSVGPNAPKVKPTIPLNQPHEAKNNPTNVELKTTAGKPVPAQPTPIVLKPNEIALTKDLLNRTFEESAVIEVEVDSLFIELYDNGEVDGDTVAVFYNRQLLLSKQGLSAKPIKLVVPIDTTTQEISMYAENIGTIPPNTAICIITAGGKRYELTLTSTFIRNGTIRFRKKTAAQIQRDMRLLN